LTRSLTRQYKRVANVTHDDQLPPRPTGPTPEEISARLEALLKRTHALRQAQAAADASMPHDGPAWPPHEADIEAVEVMDAPVARVIRGDHTPPDTPEPARPSAPAKPSDGADSASASPEFGRPDWSSLRLRDTPVEPSGTPPWVWLVMAALVVALGVESAYLVRTAPWARDADTAAPVALRIEGSPQVRVRVNDDEALPLPLERTIGSGALVLGVDVVDDTRARVAGDTPPAAQPDSPPSPAPVVSSPAASASATGGAAIGATTGSVLIESSPSGAIVTMGGRERGPTPITIGDLRPGRHDVLVVGEGWRRALKVDVTAGATARLLATGAAQP
jgi:hypothetical protein